MIKKELIRQLIDTKEKGYVNDKDDSGGPTKYGVTQEVARAFGYYGDMKDMTYDLAVTIYSKLYWDSLKLTKISQLSNRIAEELFDTGVNLGIEKSAKFLQKSLNVLNYNQKYYNDLVVDGLIGPITIYALKRYLQKRPESGETVLYSMLNCLQGSFYVKLAEKRKKDEKFIFGWFKKRVTVK